MGSITVVKRELSTPRALTERDQMRRSVHHQRGACPTSSHSGKRHYGDVQTRRTLVKTFADGSTSTSYVDAAKCMHCGFEWEAEWSWLF